MKALTRLIKAFLVSAVAVTTFINAPRWYTTMEFWVRDLKPANATTASAGEVIQPIRLPISDILEQPLPNQAMLIIDRIGVSVPLVFGIPSEQKKIYDNLVNGVVHYSETPKPGQGGATVLLGHSSLYPWQVNKFGAPFALIGKLQPGDRISIKYSDGRTFNYVMRTSIVFNPLESEDDVRLQELESSPRPILLLVTCWPVNTTQSRLALQAELE